LEYGVLSLNWIIGPIFFIEMIRAEHCQQLVMHFISLLEADEQDCWFRQVGASAHTAHSKMQMLSEFFGGHIISQNLWPPPSPDLLPLDFCLWGFLKESVYENNPPTSEELKQNIELCISNISAETLNSFASNVKRGLNVSIAKSGEHF
jgi:hypothetical protein